MRLINEVASRVATAHDFLQLNFDLMYSLCVSSTNFKSASTQAMDSVNASTATM